MDFEAFDKSALGSISLSPSFSSRGLIKFGSTALFTLTRGNGDKWCRGYKHTKRAGVGIRFVRFVDLRLEIARPAAGNSNQNFARPQRLTHMHEDSKPCNDFFSSSHSLLLFFISEGLVGIVNK